MTEIVYYGTDNERIIILCPAAAKLILLSVSDVLLRYNKNREFIIRLKA